MRKLINKNLSLFYKKIEKIVSKYIRIYQIFKINVDPNGIYIEAFYRDEGEVDLGFPINLYRKKYSFKYPVILDIERIKLPGDFIAIKSGRSYWLVSKYDIEDMTYLEDMAIVTLYGAEIACQKDDVLRLEDTLASNGLSHLLVSSIDLSVFDTGNDLPDF